MNTLYKNNKVDNDVALVYGTLIPFTSTQLDYPTQYSRAGLATYGDRALLNKRYLGIIRIKNLKDTVGKEPKTDRPYPGSRFEQTSQWAAKDGTGSVVTGDPTPSATPSTDEDEGSDD